MAMPPAPHQFDAELRDLENAKRLRDFDVVLNDKLDAIILRAETVGEPAIIDNARALRKRLVKWMDDFRLVPA